jgi:carboxymethylenebutenolidase
MGTTIQLKAADGHALSAYQAAPIGTLRGAVVVIQEIFGVNMHIRAVADGYAADGYMAIAPAMYDRVARNYETGYTQPEIEAGAAIRAKLDWKQTILDVEAAVAQARNSGKVATIGYCWGGTVSWVAAARVAHLDAAVVYYPGSIGDFADEQPRCPVLCHFGENDKSPTPEVARSVLAKHPDVTGYFYPASHGFNCDHRASFHAESSRVARTRTVEFLRRQLG